MSFSVVGFCSVLPGSFSLSLRRSERSDGGGERQQAEQGEFTSFQRRITVRQRESYSKLPRSEMVAGMIPAVFQASVSAAVKDTICDIVELEYPKPLHLCYIYGWVVYLEQYWKHFE